MKILLIVCALIVGIITSLLVALKTCENYMVE